VPGDVTMQQPGSRVVWLERDGQEAATREHGDVAPRRVVVVKEGWARGLVPDRSALGENDEVAPVEMDRVRTLRLELARVPQTQRSIIRGRGWSYAGGVLLSRTRYTKPLSKSSRIRLAHVR
jgi:hypothetical protein